MTTPNNEFPDDAITSDDLSPLQGLDETEWRAGLSSRAVGGFNDGHFSLLGLVGGLVQAGADLIVGAVQAAVDVVTGIFSAVGSLFGMSSRDMAAVDQARVDAENAIVSNLGNAVDQLDEIQRAGGAYMDYPKFTLSSGGVEPHVLPLSEAMTLQEGTAWVAPHSPLSHWSGANYSDSADNYGQMATGSGYLELLEPGFWRIDFQAAVLQAGSYYAEPAEVWCYVTPVGNSYDGEVTAPVGAPSGSTITARRMSDGIQYTLNIDSDIMAYGRASAYVDQLETRWSGGNTISGTVFALLPSGGYKVTLSCAAWEHFSGGSSTFIMATKVNSSTLRDSIDGLKQQFANSLPGQSTVMELSDDQIAAMVAQAEGVKVPPVVIPDE